MERFSHYWLPKAKRNTIAKLFSILIIIGALTPSIAALGSEQFRDVRSERVVVRTNINSDIMTLDPTEFAGPVGAMVLSNTYEGFTSTSSTGSLRPMLATKWESDDSGINWRIHLRKNVKFHTGRIMTADDVRLSIEALLQRKTTALASLFLKNIVGAEEYRSGVTSHISGVKVSDEHTVDIQLTSPDVLWPTYPIPIFDTRLSREGANLDGGTGPFMVDRWQRGVGVFTRRFEDYWGAGPHIDELHWLVLPKLETALAAFDAGEVDYLAVPEGAAQIVVSEQRYQGVLLTAERAQSRHLAMNATLYPPFSDQRVREAFSLAIDRTAVVNGLFAGQATSVRGPVSPGVVGFDAQALPPLEHDIERAKRLLSAAGHPGGKGMPALELTGIDSSRVELSIYADQLRRNLGIQISVKILDRAAYIAESSQRRLAFFLNGWTADYLDAMTYLESQWASSSRFNRVQWRDQEFDRLLDSAKHTADEGARVQLYHAAERRLMEQWALVPLPVPKRLALRRKGLAGVAPNPASIAEFEQVSLVPPTGSEMP